VNSDAKVLIAGAGLSESELLAECKSHNLPPEILLGLIMTESSGRATAMRYEAGYTFVFKVPEFAKSMGWTELTEMTLQKFSFGLCQIMLATARWRGFKLHPMRLLEPKVGLAWGAFHLAELFKLYNDWPSAVSAYNQGSPKKAMIGGEFKNQPYVDKVMANARTFRA